jgi:predicted metalloprotease
MKWKNRRRSSNVEDRRASSGRVGGGFNMPSLQTLFFLYPIVKPLLRSKLGLLVIGVGAVAYIAGFNPLSLIGMGSSHKAPTSKEAVQKDNEEAAFMATVLADTEDVWSAIFRQAGYRYTPPKMVLYRGSTRSGCGHAQAQMGPFYCPGDQKIYVDLAFFDELKERFGATGDFAQAYVLAHEVGHHIQNLQGTLEKVEMAKQRSYGQKGANKLQVKVELQADCYAGVWAHHAEKMKGILERGDIDEALGAASAIGDDHIQKQTTGYVMPDSFTHGSSKQRMEWFYRGLKTGDLRSCNTFN